MEVVITYIYHSCFILTTPSQTLVFDIPGKNHLSSDHVVLIQKHIQDKDTIFLFSHGHEDHFNPNLSQFIEKCNRSQIIVSFDIGELFEESLPKEALVVEPDEKYEMGKLQIETLESNDLGVAYLLTYNGKKIYYGGDLALWIWPDTPKQAEKVIKEYFGEVLDRLKRENIDIGFSNWDPRMENLAGGWEFLKKVRPRLFVPMHTFGRHEILAELKETTLPPKTSAFIYQHQGDSISLAL